MHARSLAAFAIFTVLPYQAIAGQVCYHSAYATELGKLIDEAEAEYPKWESGRFVELSKQVADTVPCLEDKIRTDLAARVHRIMGLRARIIDSDSDRARMAFAASRSLEPKYVFPEEMIGRTDLEHVDYGAIPSALEITERAPKPSEGTVRFDGRQTLERPVTFCTIFQHINDAGEVQETAYLWPGDATPAYFTPETGEEQSAEDSGRMMKYVVGALSAGAAGAGVALVSNGAWDKDHTCIGESEDSACVLQARDRVVTGAILAGLGMAGFIGVGASVDTHGAGIHFSGHW